LATPEAGGGVAGGFFWEPVSDTGVDAALEVAAALELGCAAAGPRDTVV